MKTLVFKTLATFFIITLKLKVFGVVASPENLESTVFQSTLQDFSYFSYKASVSAALKAYEAAEGSQLKPQNTGKVGLKIYSASGKGLGTPKNLVRAVIYELTQRGFDKENIILVDQWESRLRDTGFLPPLSAGGTTFEDSPVLALEKRKNLNKKWFYNSNLPTPDAYLWESFNEGLNKSFLPFALLDFNVDFWINLPSVTSHPSVGLIGSLANATLLNITHNGRFLSNQEHASLAIAEIAAIPELRDSLEFTLLSLENFQFVGGFIYNSNYTSSEPTLLLSKNMGVLDNYMFKKLNTLRQRYRIPQWEVVPTYLKYCKQLGVCDYQNVHWVEVK